MPEKITESQPRTSPLPVVNASAQLPACYRPPTRRSFMTGVLGVFGLVALPWRWAQAKKVGLKLGQVAPLAHVGGSATVTIKGKELLLIRDTANTVRALNPMCTHKSCKVFYKPKSNDLACKCHKSQFSLAGKVMGGPAPKPLQTFAAKLNGDQIVIDLP